MAAPAALPGAVGGPARSRPAAAPSRRDSGEDSPECPLPASARSRGSARRCCLAFLAPARSPGLNPPPSSGRGSASWGAGSLSPLREGWGDGGVGIVGGGPWPGFQHAGTRSFRIRESGAPLCASRSLSASSPTSVYTSVKWGSHGTPPPREAGWGQWPSGSVMAWTLREPLSRRGSSACGALRGRPWGRSGRQGMAVAEASPAIRRGCAVRGA